MYLSVRGIGIALLVCLSSTFAHAQGCPRFDYSALPKTPEGWQALEVQLVGYQKPCLRNAEYFALLGAAYLQQGKLKRANEALERALLIDPSNGAAMLDYAESLYLSGDLFAAIDLNAQLLGLEGLVPEIEALVNARNQRWIEALTESEWRVSTDVGWDTNLNGGTSSRVIPISIASEYAELLVAEKSRPFSGSYSRTELAYQQLVRAKEKNHQIDFALTSRNSSDRGSDFKSIGLTYTSLVPASRTDSHFFGAALSAHQYGEYDLNNRLELFAGVAEQEAYGAAQKRVSLYAEARADGSVEPISELRAFYSKERLVASNWGFSLASYLGYDLDSRNVQAGGARLGAGATARLSWLLSPIVLSADLGLDGWMDRKTYSQLFEPNEPRRTARVFTSIEAVYPLSSALELRSRLAYQVQYSNLPLFRSKDASWDLGLLYRF